MNRTKASNVADDEAISRFFELSISSIIYNGRVKISSGRPEMRPKEKALERVLTSLAFFTKRLAVLREIKSSVPLLLRK